MIPLLALSLLCLTADGQSEDPWTVVRLTVFRDPYISSEHVTTCRVRADNFAARNWSGRALAFEVCASADRSACARGRFGLTLEPYGHLETVVVVPGRHDRFEVRPLRAHDREERDQSEHRRRGRRRKSAGTGSPAALFSGTGRGFAAPGADAAFSRRRGSLQWPPMKILVVGGGGREHALCVSLHKSPRVEEILCAPGNPGIAEVADCLPVAPGDIVELADLAEKLNVDLTIVGPELPLSLGIVDEFSKRQLPIFGPSRLAAQIETSKVFSKEFFRRHGIPTAEAVVCSGIDEARKAIKRFGFPVVLKADGLAGGKGVLIIESDEDAERALPLFFQERVFGAAGDRIVVEEFLRGQEASFLVLFDGATAVPLPTARDYKKVYDGDRGPNTGGMGAHSPAGVLNAETASQALKEILWPTFRGLQAEGREFRGVLYAGLMVTDAGPRVLEYNARFGDPETEVILPRVTSDMAEVLRAAAVGGLDRFLPLDVKSEACVGVVLCAAGYPGNYERGRPIHGLAEAARLPGVEIFHAGTARDGDRLVTAGGRVLVVTAAAASMTEAAVRAYEAADRIHFEGKQLRRDIAAGGIRPSRI